MHHDWLSETTAGQLLQLTHLTELSVCSASDYRWQVGLPIARLWLPLSCLQPLTLCMLMH
eukprot:148158-Chlamydomonas_euryale.AAC.2